MPTFPLAAVAYRFRAGLLAPGLVLCCEAGVAAQTPARVTVPGQVVEAGSGSPVAAAVVKLPALGVEVATDAQGRFVLRRVPEGSQTMEVDRLGYVGVRQEVALRAGEPLRIELTGQPLVLAGIRVAMDRLRQRRERVAYAAREVTRERILDTGITDAADLVEWLGIRSADATGTPAAANRVRRGSVAMVRGVPREVVIYLDDQPFKGGLAALEGYPARELYSVEWFAGASRPMLRLYTTAYVDGLVRTGRSLPPIIW